MLIPILSSIFGSIGGLSDKLNLNLHKTSGQTYATLLFVAMSLVATPLMFIFQTNNTVTPYTVLIVLAIVIGSALQNILFYTGLANKNLSSLEPIINMESLVIILIAFAVFPLERSSAVLILGIISSLALLYSHIQKDKFRQYKLLIDKYTCLAFLAIIVAGFVHVGYKIALQFYSPVTLFFIRVIGVALLMLIVSKLKVKSVMKKQYVLLFLSASLYTVAGVLKNMAIIDIGISQTVLILMASPAIAYTGSVVLLKEKLQANRVVASIIIVSCVILSLLLTAR